MEDNECGNVPFDVTRALKRAIADILPSSDRGDLLESVKVFQSSREVKKGDFVIPVKSLKVVEDRAVRAVRAVVGTICSTHEIADKLLAKSSGWPLPLSSCNLNTADSCLYIKLHRQTAFHTLLTSSAHPEKHVQSGQCSHSCHSPVPPKSARVQLGPESWKQTEDRDPTVSSATVLLNYAEELFCSESELPLVFLRGILVKSHLANVLTANGFDVNYVQHKELANTKHLHEFCGIKGVPVDTQDLCNIQSEVIDALKSSSYTTNREETNQITVDLRDFITGSCYGNTGYDRNLATCQINLDKQDNRLSMVTNLESALSRVSPDVEEVICIHLVSQPNLFTIQQADLLWQIASPKAQKIKHCVCVVGPVQSRKNKSSTEDIMTVDDLIRLRQTQLREVSEMKYGENVRGKLWEDTIKSMTLSTLTFELLTTVLRNPVKLDLATSQLSLSNKGGAFVQYNYARLATMFEHYQRDVSKGIYPALPDIEDVDFSRLQDESEWSLLFKYVYSYPLIVREILGELTNTEKLLVNTSTHKMCSFLCSLSQDLSSYYGRVHILGEPRAHLYPTMFARLHLMRSVQRVMEDGLSILGLPTVQQV